jgi:uncharacterized protein with HEPN domain
VSRGDGERIADIVAALDAIDRHLARAPIDDGLVFDAVRMRLVEVGEAAKGLTADLRASEPEIPWRQLAGMRDFLAHRYFDTLHGEIEHVVAYDLRSLREAITRLKASTLEG